MDVESFSNESLQMYQEVGVASLVEEIAFSGDVGCLYHILWKASDSKLFQSNFSPT